MSTSIASDMRRLIVRLETTRLRGFIRTYINIILLVRTIIIFVLFLSTTAILHPNVYLSISKLPLLCLIFCIKSYILLFVKQRGSQLVLISLSLPALFENRPQDDSL